MQPLSITYLNRNGICEQVRDHNDEHIEHQNEREDHELQKPVGREGKEYAEDADGCEMDQVEDGEVEKNSFSSIISK